MAKSDGDHKTMKTYLLTHARLQRTYRLRCAKKSYLAWMKIVKKILTRLDDQKCVVSYESLFKLEMEWYTATASISIPAFALY
jgi:hypothetical protein